MKVQKIKCNKNNYGDKRPASAVRGIVLHYTGMDNDKAVSEGKYFSNAVQPPRSAHYFIDSEGIIIKSVPRNRVAWSVGTPKAGCSFNNYNTISIELCDIKSHDITDKQLKSLKWLIRFIKKRHKNALAILRHYDINEKLCPARYVDQAKWFDLQSKIFS